LTRYGLDGPIIRKSTDIFSGSATVSAAAPDPLANHIIADPGFSDGKTKSRKKKSKSKTEVELPPLAAPTNPAEKTGDHPVFENPFLASSAALRKPPRLAAKDVAPPKPKSKRRNRIFGVLASLLGSGGIIGVFFRGLPEGSVPYVIGSYVGLGISAILLLVGVMYVFLPVRDQTE
jgi:hypothetical protein